MRDYDIIVYGATGYTGRLVAEYIAVAYPQGVRWAMAGRSLTKLQEVRAEMGISADVPLITANADDPASLRAMCERTTVVITTVGPYQLYGSDLVAACAATGTAYVDLCGEPGWMRRMIDAHHEQAKASGARIVFSCGFDSIPFDLGVLTLQEAAMARFGRPAPRVKGRVRTEGRLLGRHRSEPEGNDGGGSQGSVADRAARQPLRADPGAQGRASADRADPGI